MWISMKSRSSTCPIGEVVALFGDSCSLLIVRDLLEGPKRFSDLEKSLTASTRTLAKKLKQLEHEKIVMRKANKESACVQYRLTAKGAAFQDVVDAMRSYGKKYL